PLFLPAGADGATAAGPVDALVPLPVPQPFPAQAVLVPHTRCWFATCSGIADSASSVLARLESHPRLFVPPPSLGFADSARVTEFLRDAGSPSATAFETVVLTDTVTQLHGRVSLCVAFAAVAVVPELVDAVVDCGPGSTGAERLHVYAASGLRAVLCGGVPHRSVGLTFCTSGNYAAALGRTAARVTSCNTTALVRLLAALRPALPEGRAHATLVRSASEPDKPRKGASGATVTLGPSHHAADVRLVLPWARLTTLALEAPMVHGHLLTLAAQLDSSVQASEAAALLAAARRIVVRDAPR